ncbi:MAG TPA: PepSY-associated TM helix domain-containing protein, partial [Longimicrobium sp.]
MKRFRSLIFWCHLVAGVFAGIVVLIMSVTGVLLTYQRQITLWADMRSLEAAPPSPEARRLAPEALVERVLRTEKGNPTALTWRAGRDMPVQVAFGRERTVFASAYTGEVLGQGGTGVRAFFRKVTDLHRWLGAGEERRPLGKAITGASNLAFLFLVVSGFYLWWPSEWSRRMLRSITWFRRGLRPKARDFNWHNTIGFWSAIPLFFVVLSGVVISYPWASALVFRSVGEAPPPPAGRPGGKPLAPAVALAGVDAFWPRVTERVPGWRIITLNLPKKPDAPFVFSIDRGNGGEPQKRASLTLDRATGRETKWEPFAATSPGRRLRSILRFAHTGEVLGIPGQTLAGIVSLGAAVLVWTGLSLSLRRVRAWRGRRSKELTQRHRGTEMKSSLCLCV